MSDRLIFLVILFLFLRFSSILLKFTMSDIKIKDPAVSENHSSEKDGSLGDVLDAEVGALPFTAEEERRVKLKTDLVILPLLCGVFFLQYIDKQSLSYASVFGLITDLKLKGTDYSWCSSIFYIGEYLLAAWEHC
jgi:hypothetical protein